ncbi:hypothetical protein D3C72_2426490 [compost metagenome]
MGSIFQLLKKLLRLFLQKPTYVFQHRCGQLIVHFRLSGEGDKTDASVEGACYGNGACDEEMAFG